MRAHWLLAGVVLVGAAAPQNQPGTVKALVEAVRSALAAKQPDKALAKSLSKLRMSERVDAQVLEELESEGAGAAALEELGRLREESEGEPPPAEAPPFPSPARPSLEDMRAVVQAARTYALGYANSLPDFLCTQAVKRYEDPGPERALAISRHPDAAIGLLGTA